MSRRRSLSTLLALVAALLPRAGSAQEDTSSRRAIEQRYEENRAAFLARDASAIMRLRHPDFYAIDPSGRRMSRAEFAGRTEGLLAAIEHFDTLTFHIDSLRLDGDTAVLIVRQRSVRQQRLADGSEHLVQTAAVQREAWLRTRDGWLMWRVDQVHPAPVLVDGRPR